MTTQTARISIPGHKYWGSELGQEPQAADAAYRDLTEDVAECLNPQHALTIPYIGVACMEDGARRTSLAHSQQVDGRWKILLVFAETPAGEPLRVPALVGSGEYV